MKQSYLKEKYQEYLEEGLSPETAMKLAQEDDQYYSDECYERFRDYGKDNN